jgi:predicted transcriptional regulator
VADESDAGQSATEAEVKAVASAVRLRILRLCTDRALTNKEIAEKLEANPATVLHHVRTLVATGFLAAQEERIGARGAREIPYLATRKTWRLRWGEEHWSDLNGAMLQVFQSEVARLDDPAQVNTSRLGLRLNEEQYEDFQRRLRALLDHFAGQEPGPGAKPYSLFVALHPDVDRR